jgi:hypothetical protein
MLPKVIAVEVPVRAIKAPSPFDRAIAIGIGGPLDQQQRCADLHTEEACGAQVCGNCTQALLGTDLADAVIAFEQAVEGAFAAAQALERQPGKKVGDQVDLIEDDSLTAEAQNALDDDDRVTGPDTEHGRDLGIGPLLPA